MIRILLADDHPIVLEGLRAVLETQPDFEVLGAPGQAASGEEALRLALELGPDILLLDLEMPLMDGVETLRRLRRQELPAQKSSAQPSPRVIVFTAFDSDERIITALAAGANGYLLKGAPREDIFQAIRIAMQGGSLLQPVIASKLLDRMRAPRPSSESQPPYEALTERELEVLTLLAQGMPNKEIAAHLVISERTAKFHVSSIMGKLGATNRTEAVALAAQRGLIPRTFHF